MSETVTPAPLNEDANNTDVTPPAPPPQEPDINPSKEILERYKSDMLKFKADLEAKEKQISDMKIEKLKESKNWQEISRINGEEAEKHKKNYEGLAKALLDQKKIEALRTAATKAGINPNSLDDIELLDFPEVRLEDLGQGKIIVHGADSAVTRLKTIRSHWFTRIPANVNPQSPEVRPPGAPLNFSDLNKLQEAYKKNPRDPETRKAYESAILQFKSQKK